MTKSKARTLSALLILVIALPFLSFAQMAEANFVSPPSNPIITFKSPVNTTYNTNNISLTVEFYTYKTMYYGAPDEASMRQFEYSLDGNKPQPIEITNSNVGINPGTDVYFEGLINLSGFSEGRHGLLVKVVFNYTDPSSQYGLPSDHPYAHINNHTESASTAYFIVKTIPDSPSPLLIIMIVAVLVATASFLLFRRHRKRTNLVKSRNPQKWYFSRMEN